MAPNSGPSGTRAGRTKRYRQRGVAVLAATLVLVVAMTLMAGYLHRSLLFTSRSAANQWRATRAFHTAEAGFDWAFARLNDPTPIGDDCRPDPGGISFRARYLQPDASGAFSPASIVSTPGSVSCIIGAGLLSCTCPPPSSAPAPAPAPGPAPSTTNSANLNDDARFTVGFTPVPGDPRAVTLTAHGCTDLAGNCASGDDQAALQAFARVQAIIKSPPAASQPTATMAIVPGSWHDE